MFRLSNKKFFEVKFFTRSENQTVPKYSKYHILILKTVALLQFDLSLNDQQQRVYLRVNKSKNL